MSKIIWPAIRTVGIAIAVAILPAIYQQVHQESKDQQTQYYTILAEISELKTISLSHFAGLDQQCKDLDYRVTELERHETVYRK